MTLCCLQLLCLYSRYVKGDIVLFAAVVVVFQICEG